MHAKPSERILIIWSSWRAWSSEARPIEVRPLAIEERWPGLEQAA
jgi:hypothetical protein